MDDKEFKIASRLGASTLVVYLAVKKYPKDNNTLIALTTGLSDGTIKKAIKSLKETNVLKEQGNKYSHSRELIVNVENEWRV